MADSEISTKRCTKCEQILPLGCFWRCAPSRDGLQPKCKACRTAAHKAYYANNRDELGRKNKIWRDANQDLVKSGRAAYYAAHKEELVADEAARRSANREARRLYDIARWHDPDSGRKERSSIWRSENPHIVANSKRQDRARRKGADGSFTASDIDAIAQMQKGKCAYCRKSIKNGYHVDHIVPLSKGGSNWPKNLQLTCKHCNSSKHAKDPIEYARGLGRLL